MDDRPSGGRKAPVDRTRRTGRLVRRPPLTAFLIERSVHGSESGRNLLMRDYVRTMLPPMATTQEKLSVEEAPQSLAKVSNKYYVRELARLQVELVKQQEYIRA